MYFSYGFQTISEDEVIFSEECVQRSEDELFCETYEQYWNHRWMTQCYGKKEADTYRKQMKRINNVGLIIGGTKPGTRFSVNVK